MDRRRRFSEEVRRRRLSRSQSGGSRASSNFASESALNAGSSTVENKPKLICSITFRCSTTQSGATATTTACLRKV